MKKIIGAVALFGPTFAFAQNAFNILDTIQRFISRLVPLVITLAVLAFFWGLFQYIRGAGDEGKREEGRSMMIYSVIAFTVMVSLWGLVGILQNTFGLQSGNQVPGSINNVIPGGINQ